MDSTKTTLEINANLYEKIAYLNIEKAKICEFIGDTEAREVFSRVAMAYLDDAISLCHQQIDKNKYKLNSLS